MVYLIIAIIILLLICNTGNDESYRGELNDLLGEEETNNLIGEREED